MEEAISLDLDGKLALKLRLVRGQVVVARAGWGEHATGDCVVFNPVAGWYPTDLHVGIYEAA
jgi:hypothetical protein